jgi:WhiB family redox-sensing transcriptional regulator
MSNYEWMDEAACRQPAHDLAWWHPEPGHRGVNTARKAKKICFEECPVREACLEHAMKFEEMHGIWGGLSKNERRDVRRGRRDVA